MYGFQDKNLELNNKEESLKERETKLVQAEQKLKEKIELSVSKHVKSELERLERVCSSFLANNRFPLI